MRRLLTPNNVTAARVLMGGAAVGFYAGGTHSAATAFGIAALTLTIAAIALDGLDGYLARRMNLSTPLGAQLDVLGDRVIENLFFTCFAVCGEISLWVPVIFFVRGAITDFLRGLAASRAATAYGGEVQFRRNWMLNARWSSLLVASRTSRVAYAALKCLTFCALGMEWVLIRSHLSPDAITFLAVHASANFIVAATVFFCLLRAIPVFWEGRQDFLALAHPSAPQPGMRNKEILRAPTGPMATAR